MSEESEPELEGLLSARQAISRYGLTYKQLWEADITGGVVAVNRGPRAVLPSFRQFMLSQDFEGPDASWAPEDVEAWFADAGASPE